MECLIILKKKKVFAVLFFLLLLQVFFFSLYKSGMPETKSENYIESYHESIVKIVNQADNIDTISIFSNNKSFSTKNLEQTKKDFEKLLSLEPVSFDGTFLDCFFSYTLGNYISLIACLFILMMLNTQDKQGLRSIIFSAKRGRGSFVFRKILALSICELLITVIFYGVAFVESIVICGGFRWGILQYPIQSLEIFKNLVLQINIGTFMCLYVLFRWFVLVMITLATWMIFDVVNQRVLSVGIIGIITIVEYLAYQIIGVNHYLNYLHYLNFYYLLRDNSFFSEYKNLNFFSYAVNKNMLVIWTGIIIIFVAAFTCVFIGQGRYPYTSRAYKIEQWIAKIGIVLQEKSANLQESMSLLCAEYYKLMIPQKGLIILISLTILFISQIDVSEVKHSGYQEMYYDFIEQNCGEPNAATERELSALKIEINEVDEEYEKACQLYEEGELSEADYINVSIKNESYDNDRLFLKEIEEQTEYLQELKKQKGIVGWYVNNYSFAHLLQDENQIWNMMLLIGVMMLSSGLFSIEKRSGIKEVIRGTKKGRGSFYKNKFVVLLSIIFIMYVIFSFVEIYSTAKIYGLDGLHAPIQSIEWLSFVPFNISIRCFIFTLYIIKGIWLLALGSLIAVVSLIYSQKMIFAMTIIGCLPLFLENIGITGARLFSLSEIMSVFPVLLGTKNIWMFFIVSILALMIAMFFVLVAYRKWCVIYVEARDES